MFSCFFNIPIPEVFDWSGALSDWKLRLLMRMRSISSWPVNHNHHPHTEHLTHSIDLPFPCWKVTARIFSSPTLPTSQRHTSAQRLTSTHRRVLSSHFFFLQYSPCLLVSSHVKSLRFLTGTHTRCFPLKFLYHHLPDQTLKKWWHTDVRHLYLTRQLQKKTAIISKCK